MKTIIASLLCFLVFGSGKLKAQAPDWQWAVQSINAPGASITPAHMCSDPQGNIYLTGRASGKIILNAGKVNIDSSGNSSQSYFLLKFNKDGNALHILQVNDDIGQYCSIATDSLGNCYLAATCSSSSITLKDSFSIVTGPYIIKLDSAGTIKWVKNFPGRKYTTAIFDIASTKLGDLFITGFFSDTITWFGKTLSASSGNSYNIFTGRVSSAGDLLWLKKAGGKDRNSIDEGSAICITDNAENPEVYVAGTAREDTTFFDNLFIVGRDSAFYAQANSSRGGGFIAKYDGSGNIQWVKGSDSHTGSFIDIEMAGMCSDHSGNIYLSGSFDADLGFFNVPDIHTIQKTNFNHNAFLVKLENSGTIQWLRTNISESYDDFAHVYGGAVCLDDSENVYLSGSFIGLTSFNGDIVLENTPEYYHMYIMKFQPDGSIRWMLKTDESAYAPVLYANDHLYAGGYFSDSLNLSGIFLRESFSGSNNLFLARLGNIPSSVYINPTSKGGHLSIYPNPTSSQATVNFIIAKPGNATLEIFDFLGRKVKQISLGELNTGEHSEEINLLGFANGSYIYRLQTPGVTASGTFSIIK